MKMTTRRENETVLHLPGVAATKTALVVFDSATDDQLTAAFGHLAKIDRSLAWWIGDIGIALQDRRRKILAKEASELRGRANECTTDADGMEAKRRLIEKAERLENLGVIEYTRELCAAFDISESYVMNCVTWARFYDPSNRLEGLTPKHHQVAMQAAGGAKGNVGVAQNWLTAAREKQLSAAELRKEVNVSKAAAEPPPVEIEPLSFPEIAAADAWCMKHQHEIAALSHDEAVRRYTQMQGIMDFGAALLVVIKEKAPAPVEAFN